MPCGLAVTLGNATTNCWPFPPSTQEAQLDEKWSFIAKKEDHVTGADPPEWGDAWDHTAVDPEHRSRGVATMLLEQLFDLTADDARRGYTLEGRVSNRNAIELYERLGFRARGLRRGYYTDNREDALIMWKDPVSR